MRVLLVGLGSIARKHIAALRQLDPAVEIVAWRSSADLVEKFIHKGSQIYVEGKLRTRQWTDQTGNKRYTTEVVADTLQLLGKRPDDAPQGQQPAYQGGYAAAPVNPGYAGPLPAAEPTDDLPF